MQSARRLGKSPARVRLPEGLAEPHRAATTTCRTERREKAHRTAGPNSRRLRRIPLREWPQPREARDGSASVRWRSTPPWVLPAFSRYPPGYRPCLMSDTQSVFRDNAQGENECGDGGGRGAGSTPDSI